MDLNNPTKSFGKQFYKPGKMKSLNSFPDILLKKNG